MKTVSIILFLFTLLFACEMPKPGWGQIDLLMCEEADEIVLAKVISIEKRRRRDVESQYVFELVEPILGSVTDTFSLTGESENYRSCDFNKHRDEIFWNSDTGRSDFPCCVCGPLHAYRQGETYLLFLDAMGAMKSAEVIRSKDDWWYIFVKKQIAKRK